MGFCMALHMNSAGIPGGFWGNAGFPGNLGFWGVSGDLGPQKAFAQIASLDEIVGFSTAECLNVLWNARRGSLEALRRSEPLRPSFPPASGPPSL